MTQEELDALMAGDLDDVASNDEPKEDEPQEAETAKEEAKEQESEKPTDEKMQKDYENYRATSQTEWPPPPPTSDHKMVHQLDDVTKDSEIKAGEIFDKLESVNNYLMDMEEDCGKVSELTEKNIELFTTLQEHFPSVQRFEEALTDCNSIKESLENVTSNSQMAQDEIMMTMDIMQYQDIHRQKIERVINVMRALSKYMSSLFEGKIDDEKRVSSAVHIQGDETADVVSNEDIEALISSLGSS